MIKYPKSAKTKLINYFWFEIYPDSAPSDWVSRLDSFMVCYIISPLHDKDLKDNGTSKKPHYHVIVLFEGGKSPDLVQEICDYCGGANGYVEVIIDKRKAIRYLSHIDHPHKFQYSRYDYVCSGVTVSKYFDDDDETINKVALEIFDWIRDTHCRHFNVLVDYCLENNKKEWFNRLRRDLSPIVKNYMSGIRYQIEDDIQNNRRHKNSRSKLVDDDGKNLSKI